MDGRAPRAHPVVMELCLLAFIVALAVLAPRFGVDSHRSREWGDPIETWSTPDPPLRSDRMP